MANFFSRILSNLSSKPSDQPVTPIVPIQIIPLVPPVQSPPDPMHTPTSDPMHTSPIASFVDSHLPIKKILDDTLGKKINDRGARKLPKKVDNVRRRVVRSSNATVVLNGDVRDMSHPIEIKSMPDSMKLAVDQEHRFTDEQRLRICEMIAQFRTEQEISTFASNTWGIPVTRQKIYQYIRSPKWRGLIDKFRIEYVSQVMDIPITHKKIRL